MSDPYAREILRRNVAQICQTIGWNGINSTPLDILVHVLEKYILTLGIQTNRYAEQFNRTEPNLNDLGLVFQDLNIQLPELVDYVQCVPPVSLPVQVDKIPKPKDSNLNFLKPGSHEVVTRPMHVHEHLPPMYPEKERDTPAIAGTVEIKQNGKENGNTSNATCAGPEILHIDCPEKPKDIFKRPIGPISLSSQKLRSCLDEEERTREISSVMMTMSGFLSPACEGKLPEAYPLTIITEKLFDKHLNAHYSTGTLKAAVLEKSDKKSKKNKLKLSNGKIIKSKRKDRGHKSESSKTKVGRKMFKHPSGNPIKKRKDVHQRHLKNLALPVAKTLETPLKSNMPASVTPLPEPMRALIKHEPIDILQSVPKVFSSGEDAIPIPKRIPISKSPLVPAIPANKKTVFSPISLGIETKIDMIGEDKKLASQPDRSKINIFKRISSKSKEDKMNSEDVLEKSQSETGIWDEPEDESIKGQSEVATVSNKDTGFIDLFKPMDLRAHEVISIDDESLEMKKEKKHKDKKDKSVKLEAKLLKRQLSEMAQAPHGDKQNWKKIKPSKVGNPKKNSRTTPGFPYLFSLDPSSSMPTGQNLSPGLGLIPPSLVTNSEIFPGLSNSPTLRGLPSSSLANPFVPGLGIFQRSGLPKPLMHMGDIAQSSHSSPSVKIPTILRRPSLEVIPVENNNDRIVLKPQEVVHGKDRRDKHKSPSIPNILQKQKSKLYTEHKSHLCKMPPVQPDITIQLNPRKAEQPKRDIPATPVCATTPELGHQPKPVALPASTTTKSFYVSLDKATESVERKSEKLHKKEKKDKDFLKIKKKKDKKDKHKYKSEKKKVKDALKEKVKQKKEKKKIKSGDCLVPKLTLKLSSSNSNSPMPPSSPDIFKLNIKPVVKKEQHEESLSVKEDSVSREHNHSPELAQISALVTGTPKQKHLKPNNSIEEESYTSSSPVGPSPRKNRPPSGHSKYKRIVIKPLCKKSQSEDAMTSNSEEAMEPPSVSAEKFTGPLPTPYYVDEHGNKIWVCPACGRPDNGSPMIGCDGCDGWYHWVCVGITEEPGATEDWFCKSCVSKRTAMVLAGVTTSSKKRGRKTKGEQ